nr:zinc knuckle CX2CX4HX4C [Tanacetum cinerariifolium]
MYAQALGSVVATLTTYIKPRGFWDGGVLMSVGYGPLIREVPRSIECIASFNWYPFGLILSMGSFRLNEIPFDLGPSGHISRHVPPSIVLVQFDAYKQPVEPLCNDASHAVSDAIKNVDDAAGMNFGSYASLLQKHPNKKLVRISELKSDEIVEGAAVTIPISAVEEVSARFENTLYDY